MFSNIYSNTKQLIKKNITNITLATGLALGVGAVSLPAEAQAKKCVPHYLENIRHPKNKLESLLEKERVYRTLQLQYPGTAGKNIINGSLEREVDIQGVDVTLVFPNYVKIGKNIRHYHGAGIDTYSQKEFECVVQDQIKYLTKSAHFAMSDYKDLLDQVLKAQEKALKKAGVLKKDEKLRDKLDDKIEGYENLKVRDILFTPDINIKDFVPRKYYFSDLSPGVLGVSYTNTGMVGIDPKARVLDHINGWPAILVHEMTHRNEKLQGMPVGWKADMELWASFPMLLHSDMRRLLDHGYLRDVRKLAKILFDFDSKLVYPDITSLDLMMGVELETENRYEKVREYASRVETISKEVRDVAFNKYIPEFYTHPLYFMALNDFMNDPNASFKLMMYTSLEPRTLGGAEKTRDFVQENLDIVKEVTRSTMKELKKEQENKLNKKVSEELKKELKNRFQKMDSAEKEKLLRTAKLFGMPENGNFEEIIQFGMRLYNLGLVDFNLNEKPEVLK